jgi:protein O-mannosyl-transferase
MKRFGLSGKYAVFILPLVLLTFLNLLLYAKTLFFGLTGLDDVQLIQIGKQLVLNPSGLIAIFRQPLLIGQFDLFYRPMLLISFWFDSCFVKYIPFIYHFSNIIYHIAAAFCLFLLLKKLRYSSNFSVLSALIFSIHPVLVSAVAWIPGRNDILLALMVLICFITFIDFLRSGKIIYLIFHLFFLAAALFTKETALALPVVCLAYPYLIKDGISSKNPIIKCFSGWVVVLIAWLYLRSGSITESIGIFETLKAVIFKMPLLASYLGKAIIPVQSANLATKTDSVYFYGFLALLILAVPILLSKHKKIGNILFGTVWFAAFLVPTFALRNDFLLEHRMYVSLIGLFFIIPEMSGGFKKLGIDKITLKWLAIAIIPVFFIKSFFFVNKFSDKLTFWEFAAITSPRSPIVHTNLGEIYSNTGRAGDSLMEFEKAYKLEPKGTPNSTIYAYNLAYSYEVHKEDAKAEAIYLEIVDKTKAGDSKILYSYGKLCLRQGRTKEAEGLFIQAVKVNAYFIDFYRRLIELYAGQKQSEKEKIWKDTLLRLYSQEGKRFMFIEDSTALWFQQLLKSN